MRRHFAFELLAGGLVVLGFFLGGLEGGVRGAQLFVERFGDAGKLIDSVLDFLNGEVDALETDELLEVRHSS